MAILQTHHITYEPEWTVELFGYMHRAISIYQRSGATPERYMVGVAWLHALSYEVNRMRQELDTGADLRVKKMKV